MYEVGIIGCGIISESHYKGFTRTGRARVTRVFDTDPEAAAGRAAEWGAEAAPDAGALINSVDLVTIAAPGFAHRQYVEAAAAASKPVLCEKPVALNMADALAMKKAVDDSGVPFLVAFSQRYDRPLAQLRALQREGRIGATVSAWARLHSPASTERWRTIEESGHWRASMELSGGRINEFSSHSINWLLWVLGRPLAVYGRALRVTEGFNLDDADYALITCEGGVGLLDVQRHAGIAPELNYGIQGHGGSVALKDEVVRLTLMDAEPVEVPITVEVTPKHEHFLDCVEGKARPLNDIDDAIETLKVCLAFNRSAAGGRVEEVE